MTMVKSVYNCTHFFYFGRYIVRYTCKMGKVLRRHASDVIYFVSRADPDQTALKKATWSESALFAKALKVSL